MALKPWYTVITPREDLREGKPLDAAEFAVNLDKVRAGTAPKDYQDPAQFFRRTFLTQNLLGLAAEAVRRLSGERTETSAVFNMATQFGGGKTHALTLLYHLARLGPKADGLSNISRILEKAGISSLPQAETAVFAGTEFDTLSGRGGNDGTPLRKTPWGEIAFQLGGEEGFRAVAEHDAQVKAPAGDVIRKFLPKGKPALILIDELMNFVSVNRKSGMAAQLYNFIQNLSEAVAGEDRVVLVVSVPASEMELSPSPESQGDYDRFKKMLDRLGKAIFMAVERETSEIIRRRLFEVDDSNVTQEGRIILPKEAHETCKAYADWAMANRQQLPGWFDFDHARDVFAATYPFHPTVISVFERKWQSLERFQRTRGILRLLALWVSKAYPAGFQGAHKDALIGLGTAPLEDSLFRGAVFEQLGENLLDVPVTTDICGKADSHAVRLDAEATEAIKRARLHRKVATTVFFESNGGQTREEATIPEIRLGVGEPAFDIGNVETVLETLETSSYYLSVEKNRYKFSLRPNLNKMLSDRRAGIPPQRVGERVRSEAQKIFAANGLERIFFPDKSSQIPDRPVLTFVVLPPEKSLSDEPNLKRWMDSMTREYGSSARTFKSALIWCVPDSSSGLKDEARKVMAWEDIREQDSDRLDEGQRRQLDENLRRAQRDIREAVWRSYKNVFLLGKDNHLRLVDLGLINSSQAKSLSGLIVDRLREQGDVERDINPNFLKRKWPPAFQGKEWSTKSARDAFFASPEFPRLLNGDAIKETIAQGIGHKLFAYVGKPSDGEYKPFIFAENVQANEIEISEDMYLIEDVVAEAYLKAKATQPVSIPDITPPPPILPPPVPTPTKGAAKLVWSGEVPWQKWANFYQKVLSRFTLGKGMKLTVNVEIAPEEGVSPQKIEEAKNALRELGLNDELRAE